MEGKIEYKVEVGAVCYPRYKCPHNANAVPIPGIISPGDFV